MFIDYTEIYVEAGNGGDGCVSFRREKYVAKGGPDGGDGGKGGSIIFEADPNLGTLLDFQYNSFYKAKSGGHGSGGNKKGADAEDIIIKVPVGTVVYELIEKDEEAVFLHDFVIPYERFVVAKGGIGGKGNSNFATPTNRAPRKATPGKLGEKKKLILELKLIADVGLVGYPNAGKSTLLSVISAAKPKIADYPFTTLKPNLGITKLTETKSCVVADIPGIIDGAHEGKGLGLLFLRHIQRTSLLLFLIDITSEDPISDFKNLKKELKEYDEDLLSKPRLLVFNKIDMIDKIPTKLKRIKNEKVLFISGLTQEGIKELKLAILNTLEQLKDEA